MKSTSVWGITELFVWMYEQERTGTEVEDMLQAHLDCGIKSVIWALGRSVLNYHSDLPNTTLYSGDERPETAVIGEAMQERCCLRAALRFAEKHQMTLYGRLCMNRHYAGGYGGGLTSEWAASHREWHCVGKDGERDGSRMSYFFPEVRQERVDILCEAARIGCHGLVLDFCRQIPMMRYHPELVDAYMKQGNTDPRTLDVGSPEFMEWARFRAEYVTRFMRQLREALREVESDTGRDIPVVARVPDLGLKMNVMESCDIETWAREDLIDVICTDPFRWVGLQDYPDTIAPYVRLGETSGIPVWGGCNTTPMENVPVDPLSMMRLALRQYDEGADGMALYQTDTGCVDERVNWAIELMDDPEALRDSLEDPDLRARYRRRKNSHYFGLDNHTRVAGLTKHYVPFPYDAI
ncbi:MAG: hypothetical protein ACLFWB_06450 [Armatimonadota bacterium]